MGTIIAAPDCATWAGRRDQALFTLLYNTGARVFEPINLKVGDVVLDVSPVNVSNVPAQDELEMWMPRPVHGVVEKLFCQA
jgi:site-specific recombinase XerD